MNCLSSIARVGNPTAKGYSQVGRMIAASAAVLILSIVLSPSSAFAQGGTGGPGGGGGGGGGNQAPEVIALSISIDGLGFYHLYGVIDDEAPEDCTINFKGAFKNKTPLFTQINADGSFEAIFADAGPGGCVIDVTDWFGLTGPQASAPLP